MVYTYCMVKNQNKKVLKKQPLKIRRSVVVFCAGYNLDSEKISTMMSAVET